MLAWEKIWMEEVLWIAQCYNNISPPSNKDSHKVKSMMQLNFWNIVYSNIKVIVSQKH